MVWLNTTLIILKQVTEVQYGVSLRARENYTVSRNGKRYIDEDIFLACYPDAIAKEGSTYQLDNEQIYNLPKKPKP